jgi:hypothetical protein
MINRSAKSINLILLGVFFAGSAAVAAGWAQAPQGQQNDPTTPANSAKASAPYRNQPPRIANREAAYYEAVWGIEAPRVKAVESGVILQFSYRVLDPVKAKILSNKDFNPVLQSPEKGVELVIPTLEKVGQLRQAPHAFSNSGRILKPGDRVDIVVGTFHARGILVE